MSQSCKPELEKEAKKVPERGTCSLLACELVASLRIPSWSQEVQKEFKKR